MSPKKITWKKNPAQQKAIDLMQSQAVEILAEGGSRSGKTFIFLYAIFARALKTPNSQHLVCRFHLSELTRTIWQQTVPSVLSICFNNLQVKKNEQHYFIKFPNGSVVQFGGLADKQQTERILGSEYATIFINEASQISYDTYQMVKSRLNSGKTGLLDKLYIDYNPPNKNHWGYKIFHEFLDPVTKQPLSPELRHRYAVVKMNPVDNIANLSPSYIETLKSLSEKQRRRFLYGEYSDDANNALFKRIHIESNRWTAPLPKLIGCCVGVDPAVTSGENSDETGIVVAAKAQIDSKTHFFVLADNSVKAPRLSGVKR
jgi:PBSX family phage terminase large subunit